MLFDVLHVESKFAEAVTFHDVPGIVWNYIWRSTDIASTFEIHAHILGDRDINTFVEWEQISVSDDTGKSMLQWIFAEMNIFELP